MIIDAIVTRALYVDSSLSYLMIILELVSKLFKLLLSMVSYGVS
jgi:hypothetical protein